MHLRPHAVSAGSVACRVVDSPVGTLDARSCHALDSHGSPHNAAVPGLEVSRGDVLQHQLIQAQLCYQPLQLRVLLLQILQPPGLVHPQTAILFTPPEVGLLHDSRFLTRLWRRLSVRHGYFDLPQKGHYLFRTMLLASRHLPLLLFQFVSTPLAQIEPGTPPFGDTMKASVKPRSPALNAVGTAQVHGYRKSLFWWNVCSGSRKAVRHSHTCQRNLRVSLGTKHKCGRFQQREMLRQSLPKHALKHMFCLVPN